MGTCAIRISHEMLPLFLLGVAQLLWELVSIAIEATKLVMESYLEFGSNNCACELQLERFRAVIQGPRECV